MNIYFSVIYLQWLGTLCFSQRLQLPEVCWLVLQVSLEGETKCDCVPVLKFDLHEFCNMLLFSFLIMTCFACFFYCQFWCDNHWFFWYLLAVTWVLVCFQRWRLPEVCWFVLQVSLEGETDCECVPVLKFYLYEYCYLDSFIKQKMGLFIHQFPHQCSHML